MRKILLAALGIVAALALVLAGSVALDALLGMGRVDALTNASVPSGAGPPVRAYVARPNTPGPHPAVIMIHEFWGLTPDLIGKADALAQEGYLVIAPDVFRGGSTGWVPRAIFQVMTTPQEQINTDLGAVFAWLEAQPDVQIQRVAVIGFCFGGRAALHYSLVNSRLAATAVFYGSPVTDAAQLRTLPGPVLGIFGGADASIPLEEVHAFEAGLAEAGVPHQVTIYDGQGHAFVGGIESIRQGGAAGQAWDELRDFLREVLEER